MTDEQIQSMLSTSIIRPIGSGGGETLKNNNKMVTAKTPLEIQVNAMCSKMRNSKQPPSSQNWVETIFDNIELLLGKDKVPFICLVVIN